MRKKKISKMIEALLPWYEGKKRSLPWRVDKEPYHIWVSEVMLQQTRIETVKEYYDRFLKEIPDIKTLAEANPEHLHKLWEGLGYYSRVRNLQAAAKEIMEAYDGKFPDTYEEIKGLKGIGEYTAGAIGSICFNLPVPAVDGNVLRVLSRITGDTRSISEQKTKTAVRKELAEVYPREQAGVLTQAIMELGETVCIPNGEPFCEICPCRNLCISRDGEWRNLPVKAKKKERKIVPITVFILRCGEYTAVRRRKNAGLLAGLWELPSIEGMFPLEEAMSLVSSWRVDPAGKAGMCSDRHIFTHVEWQMCCYEMECRNMPECFTWVSKKELEEDIALPTAFRKLMK